MLYTLFVFHWHFIISPCFCYYSQIVYSELKIVFNTPYIICVLLHFVLSLVFHCYSRIVYSELKDKDYLLTTCIVMIFVKCATLYLRTTMKDRFKKWKFCWKIISLQNMLKTMQHTIRYVFFTSINFSFWIPLSLQKFPSSRSTKTFTLQNKTHCVSWRNVS